MRLKTKRKTTADDIRRAAVAALVSALDEGLREPAPKPRRLSGPRAIAAGAVLYATGRAAYMGQRYLRDLAGRDDAAEQDESEPDEASDASRERAGAQTPVGAEQDDDAPGTGREDDALDAEADSPDTRAADAEPESERGAQDADTNAPKRSGRRTKRGTAAQSGARRPSRSRSPLSSGA